MARYHNTLERMPQYRWKWPGRLVELHTNLSKLHPDKPLMHLVSEMAVCESTSILQYGTDDVCHLEVWVYEQLMARIFWDKGCAEAEVFEPTNGCEIKKLQSMSKALHLIFTGVAADVDVDLNGVPTGSALHRVRTSSITLSRIRDRPVHLGMKRSSIGTHKNDHFFHFTFSRKNGPSMMVRFGSDCGRWVRFSGSLKMYLTPSQSRSLIGSAGPHISMGVYHVRWHVSAISTTEQKLLPHEFCRRLSHHRYLLQLRQVLPYCLSSPDTPDCTEGQKQWTQHRIPATEMRELLLHEPSFLDQ